jgi:SIR2-like domain
VITDLDQLFLFLGAGASRPAHVPLAYEFVEAIREHLQELHTQDRDALRSAFEKACRAITKEIGNQHAIDVEYLYRAIDEALEFQFANARDQLSQKPLLKPSRALERLHYEIKKCIQKHCVITEGERTAYLRHIVDELKQCHELPIISLNYDNVIEKFCNTYQIKYLDPIVGMTSCDNHVLLLKLHGSVTWLIDESGRAVRADLEGIHYGRRRSGSATLDTPLIYPAPGKLPVQPPFVEQVARFQEILFRQTSPGQYRFSRCLAVGYSFRDRHVIDWFSAALRANQELKIVLVNTNVLSVCESLAQRDPRTDWASRILIAPNGSVEDALAGGLLQLVNAAKPIFELASFRRPAIFIKGVGGIAPTSDGKSAYLSVRNKPEPGRVDHVDLSTGSVRNISKNVVSNRALTADDVGRLFMVQLDDAARSTPGAGYGVVRAVELHTGELRDLAEALSWPTDIIWSRHLKALVATESTGLAIVNPDDGAIHHVAGPPLTLNLHAIDFLNDTTILGLELGVAQANSWGRITEFCLRTRRPRRIFDLGHARLFDICVLKAKKKILIAQLFPWPEGAILVFDYPPKQALKRVKGFHFPNRVVFHQNWSNILCSDQHGLHWIPLPEFD